MRSIVLVFLFACSSTAPEPRTDPVDAGADAPVDAGETIEPRFVDLANTIEAERKKLGAPGLAVAVVEDGKVTFAKGFGSKHPQQEDPVKPTTLFRIGSVNKMLTAAALLQLVAQGKVDLEAPVTQYLPDLKIGNDAAAAATIKVKHLLTHASGIVDYTPIEGSADDSVLASFTAGTFARESYLMAPAGRFFNYSNPNFALAGLIVEKVLGVPYRKAMKDKLFDPLGMTRTFFLGSEVKTDGDFAFAKAKDENGQDEVVGPDSYDHAWSRPAGFAWSSVLDLAKFTAFLEKGNDGVLPSAQREAMQSPQINTKDFLDLDHYGYGLSVGEGVSFGKGQFYSLRFVSHGGAIPGYAAQIDFLPSSKLAFITLANADLAYFTESSAKCFTTFGKLPAPAEPPKVDLDPAKWDRFEGNYLDEKNVGRIVVKKVGSDLTVSMPDLDKAQVPYEAKLQPYADQNFILKVQGFPLPITFIADAQGKSEYLRTRVFVGKKVDAFPRRNFRVQIRRPAL